MNLLHLDSSILGTASVSRELSAAIVARQVALHPGTTVVYRDLAAEPSLHLSGTHIAAWHGDAGAGQAIQRDLATGSAYMDELFAADIVVIGAPMYNFTVPTQLKAWVDRVSVAGKTFRYGPTGPEGLLHGKKAFIASARGGVYTPGAPAAPMEHHESYLRAVFGFMGVTDVTVVRAEGVAMGPDARAAALGQAHAEIEALAA